MRGVGIQYSFNKFFGLFIYFCVLLRVTTNFKVGNTYPNRSKIFLKKYGISRFFLEWISPWGYTESHFDVKAGRRYFSKKNKYLILILVWRLGEDTFQKNCLCIELKKKELLSTGLNGYTSLRKFHKFKIWRRGIASARLW